MRIGPAVLVAASFLLAAVSYGADAPALRKPRVQSPAPEGWREVPFVETAPAPKPTAAETARGFMLFGRHPSEPVYRETRPRGDERLRNIDLFAAPGEFEPATVGVYPLRDLINLKVSVSALSSEAGAIPASVVDVRLVTFWKIRYPSYQSAGTFRRLPELMERVDACDVPAGESVRWWLRVHVPANTRPGVYRGTVTVRDDRSPAVKTSLRVRVLPLRLKRDPGRRYSSYYYIQTLAPTLAPEKRADILKSSSAEYNAMAGYGMDMIPTLSLRMNDSGEAYLPQPDEIDRMRKAGLEGPVPVTTDAVVRALYTATTPDGAVGPHWAVGKNPPEAFHARLTEVFMRFERQRKKAGWPEFIYCPVDEVESGSREFGSRVYASLKKAGVRTYITKDTRAADAPAYAPYVDFWCSQPFSTPYERAVAGPAGYWCYPNHNAGEIKEPSVMCRGGRMTYGYGFWRSGYTVIIPWHWRWQSGPDPFDYLAGSSTSGCGVRLDDDGGVIPTPYWENFREGCDDMRYLATLRFALAEREGASQAALRALVREGRDLLREIWSSIRVRDRYLDEGLWAADDFDIYRWRAAELTGRLIRWPALREVATLPAPVDDPSLRAPEDTLPEPGPGDDMLDLGDEVFSRWKSGTAEGTASDTADAPFRGGKSLRFSVAVDHAADGGEGGKYPVGWPRVTAEFSAGELDLAGRDILSFAVRGNRTGGPSFDTLPFSVNARAHERGVGADRSFDIGGNPGVWTVFRIPVADFISSRTRSSEPWKSVRAIQFGVSEGRYPDKAAFTLDFDAVSFVRFSSPRIYGLVAPRQFVPNRPVFPVAFDVLGASSATPGSHTVRAMLLGRSGKPAAQASGDLASTRRLTLAAGALGSGKYTLRVEIADTAGKICSSVERPVLGVKGW